MLWVSLEIPQYFTTHIGMAMHGKTKMHSQWRRKKTDIFCVSKNFHFGELSAEFCQCIGESSKIAMFVFNVSMCKKFHTIFVVFVSIFICKCVRQQGFPHERWKFSSLFVEAVGEIFGACCSFVLLSNRCKTLLRKHLFFRYSTNIIFLYNLHLYNF